MFEECELAAGCLGLKIVDGRGCVKMGWRVQGVALSFHVYTLMTSS
jgi:hypothetical protein